MCVAIGMRDKSNHKYTALNQLDGMTGLLLDKQDSMDKALQICFFSGWDGQLGSWG